MIKQNDSGLWDVFVGETCVARVKTRREAEAEDRRQQQLIMEKLSRQDDE